jgi:hypothetical protein
MPCKAMAHSTKYIRGRGDGMSSHSTTPMISSILIFNVKNTYSACRSIFPSEEDEEDTEHYSIRVSLNEDGQLTTTNQFHDYFYRAPSLASMNFHDFCQCIKLEKKIHSPKNTIDSRAGVFARHALLPPHKLSGTHCLVEHWNESRGDGSKGLLPRVLGCSIPHPNAGDYYAFFMLSHFKPFSATNPLINANENFSKVFEHYPLSDQSKEIIGNWEALNESEDARDAECLKKKAAITAESTSLTKPLLSEDSNIPVLESDMTRTLSSQADFAVNQHMLILQQSNWLNTLNEMCQETQTSHPLPDVTQDLLKYWKNVVKQQESTLAHSRRNKGNPSDQSDSGNIEAPQTESGHNVSPKKISNQNSKNSSCPITETLVEDSCPSFVDMDPESVIN